MKLLIAFRNALKYLGLTSDLVTAARILCCKLVIRSTQYNPVADVRNVMWLSWAVVVVVIAVAIDTFWIAETSNRE